MHLENADDHSNTGLSHPVEITVPESDQKGGKLLNILRGPGAKDLRGEKKYNVIQEYDEQMYENCELSIYNETFDYILNTIDQGKPIVHLNLKFDNETKFHPDTAYLDRFTHYIDPLTWTWAIGHRGDALLGFPAIFVPMSVYTLSIDVIDMPVSISTDNCPHFLNFTDGQKQIHIATLLINNLEAAYSVIDEPGTRTDFKVCQEIAHNPHPFKASDTTWLAIVFNIYFVVYNTRHECWVMPPDQNGALLTSIYSSPAWLLYPTIILGIVGAVLFPLFVVEILKRSYSAFRVKVALKIKSTEIGNELDQSRETGNGQHHSKQNGNNEEEIVFYDENTNIPIGLKYVLFHWKSQLQGCYKFFVAVRVFAFTMIVFFSIYPEYAIFFLDDTFNLRKQTYFRTGFLHKKWFNAGNQACIIILCVILVIILIRSNMNVNSLLAENDKERKRFGMKSLNHLSIPKHDPRLYRGLEIIQYYMEYRLGMALDGRIFVHYWKGILFDPVKEWPWWKKWFVFAPAVLIGFPFIMLQFVVNYLSVIPGAYVIVRIMGGTKWVFKAIDEIERIFNDVRSLDDEDQGKDDQDIQLTSAEVLPNVDEQDPAMSASINIHTGYSKGDKDIELTLAEVLPDIETQHPAEHASPRFEQTQEDKSQSVETQSAPSIQYTGKYPRNCWTSFKEHASDCFVITLAVILAFFLLLLFTCFFLGWISLVFLVFAVTFGRLIFFTTFVGTVVFLTFSGLIMNALEVTPYIILALSVIGFIVGVITNLHDSYCELLELVVQIAKEECLTFYIGNEEVAQDMSEKDAKNEESRSKQDSREENEGKDDGVKIALRICHTQRNEVKYSKEGNKDKKSVKRRKKLMKIKDVNNEKVTHMTVNMENSIGPVIDQELFWCVVEKCLPLRLQVGSLALQVFLALLAVVIGITIVVDIGELHELSDIGVTITTVIITLLIPQLRYLINSKADEKRAQLKLELKVRKAFGEFKDNDEKMKCRICEQEGDYPYGKFNGDVLYSHFEMILPPVKRNPMLTDSSVDG